MSDRETIAGFRDWMRDVEQQLASLQRGDKLAGRVPVGELMIGDLLFQDARGEPGGKTGLYIRDTKSNALYYIQIPPDDTRNTPPRIVKMLFSFPDRLQLQQSMTIPFKEPLSLQGYEATLLSAPATTDVLADVYKIPYLYEDGFGYLGSPIKLFTITIPAQTSTVPYTPLPFPISFAANEQIDINLVQIDSAARALDIPLQFG